MPITYRSQVAPKYSRWIRDGIAGLRARENKGMLAALTIAENALNYQYEPMPGEVRVAAWSITARQMAMLRSHGITAETLLARVAELVAFLEDNPSACRTRREEDYAIARAVLHMVRWNGAGQGQGASMLASVGGHLRNTVVAPALALVRKLRADEVTAADVAKQAVDFTD